MDSFTEKVIGTVLAIPEGRVATYGQVARLSGSPRAARQVVRVLVSCSRAHDLPWHRVVGAPCRIALPRGTGFDHQVALLSSEGVDVSDDGEIDPDLFLWRPEREDFDPFRTRFDA
jgi:methylated-DNA-protein-cysteine methyltransferase related protein